MILTGDRVEYLPEGGRMICVELSNSRKIYLTIDYMLGEAKPSFFEKRSVVAKIILTQARFSSNNLASIIFPYSLHIIF
jgi:hypothetical protein